jgi:hypothetical protein
MTEQFRRPDLFVPLSVRFATGRTGTALQDRFGLEGLAVWAALLAACKLERPPGQITWASESEIWNKLGLTGHEPSFTFDEFLTFTGRLKITKRRNVSRTRYGRIQHVFITVWSRWTKTVEREADRERKARKAATSTPETSRKPTRKRSGMKPELEQEQEREVEKGKTTRAREALPAANGLPLAVERLILTTEATGRSAAAIRKAARDLPEACSARVLESLQARKPRPDNPAGYVVAALKAERDEHEAARAAATTSLAEADRAYPDEPDVG